MISQAALQKMRGNGQAADNLGRAQAVDDRTVDDLVRRLYDDNDSLSLKRMMDELERMIILKVLSKVNGHQRRAAKILGLKPTTLFEKAKRYRIRIEFKSIVH